MRKRVLIARAFAVCLCAGLLLATSGAGAQSSLLRSLKGTVTGENHEPLEGAVVKVENIKTESIESFVTDKDGHYDFRRLDPNADYRFFATYHGHRSKVKKLGMFDSKRDETADLTIDTK